MNRLPLEHRVQILSCLVEGNSLRATSRMTGSSKNTVIKLLIDVGAACRAYHDKHVRNLTCKRVQCEEIWSFVYSKQKNLPKHLRDVEGIGDVWTWVGLDSDSKLAVSWLVGGRDAEYAKVFMEDVASRLSNRVQLTTDGHLAYWDAVGDAFGLDVDYAMLVKQYGAPPKSEKRYSPPTCVGARKRVVDGDPDLWHISTSYVERQTLTMRMHMRRFTRLTDAFSKRVENHEHAVSLHFMHYNFVRTHQRLNVSPAMATAVTDRLWEIEDLAKLSDQLSN